MINPEFEIKDKFVEMCKLIFINVKGEFVFPIDSLLYDNDYQDFLNHTDWPILENKMKNLISIMNSDISILGKDVETEIWDLI